MPKAYDIKRNYYADLELPTTASIDDVKKQYRKLAKIWHPDRNAGKEEECVPRFQAIQAAHEILSDPVNKAQYDADRKVAGPFKSAAAPTGPAARGHPYQAASNFPPPPRRTQPGHWQRPQPQPHRSQTNGAERFSGFSGANVQPPKRSDAAQDRTNAFYRAQQAQRAQERQQQQQQQAQAAAPGPSAAPHPTSRRPVPPPRADTQYPSEEKIRQGFKHTENPAFDSEAESRRSAWQAFKGTSTPEPNIGRSNTTRTPKRQGFDPNAPGSDERPASGYYVHRHKSEDFGRPAEAAAKAQRPHIDPTDPNRRQPLADDVPFAEGNRVRTPYTSFVGEKTDVNSNMRRSKSSRDTSKLNTESTAFRPNSTSPSEASKGTTFEFPTAESDDETPGEASSPDAYQSPFSQGPKLANPAERVKKVPSPPSRRFNGAQTPFSPPNTDGTGDVKRDNIFNFGNAAPFSPPVMPSGKSRSEENINTKFASDFSGTFAGTPGATAQPKPANRKTPASFTRQNSRGRANPTFGQPSPLGSNLPKSDLPPPPPSAPADSPSHARTFSPEVWAQHFADGSWAVPPPPPGGPATAGQQDSISPGTTKPRDSGFSNGDDRMDIDDMPPYQATNDRQAMPPPPKPPRTVPVPPSQWHQQQSAKQQPNIRTNLDDLSHVEPLARDPGAGLKNFNHLSADLPFTSQASQASPVSPVDTQTKVPAIPMPPQPPQVLTQQTWTRYAAEFGMFIAAYHDFNGRLLLHFNTRHTALKMKMDKGMDWLQAAGDVSTPNGGLSGFSAFARQTEQDAKLRETWNLAGDQHAIAVRQFEAIREKVRRAAASGGLPMR